MIFEFFMLLLQAEMRIKKLDIFIAKQFGLLFVGTFFICQFVLMMQFLWRYIDELIGKGLSVEVMAVGGEEVHKPCRLHSYRVVEILGCLQLAVQFFSPSIHRALRNADNILLGLVATRAKKQAA